MRTLIADGRAIDVVARRCTPGLAATLCAGLGLPVTADVDNTGCVHLRAMEPVQTVDEVAVLAAFIAKTDSPLRWHRPADSSWTVPR